MENWFFTFVLKLLEKHNKKQNLIDSRATLVSIGLKYISF